MKKIFLAFFLSFTLTAINLYGQTSGFTIGATGPAQYCFSFGVNLQATSLPPGNWTSLEWFKADVACLTTGNFTSAGIYWTLINPLTGLYYGVLSDGQGNSIASSNLVMIRRLPTAGSGGVLPVPVAGGDVSCVSSVSLCAPNIFGNEPITIKWYKNNVQIAGATSSQYTATATGYYKYQIIDPCNSPYSDSIFVTIQPGAQIIAGGPTTFCNGGSVILNAAVAANRSYQWKKGANLISGATSSSYTASTGGNYRVIVTNTVTGCSKTTGSATIVIVNALPPATITPQGPTTFCAGGNVVLSANGGSGLSYQWKKGGNNISGATFQNYTAITGGTYKVVVTNANGCSKTSAGTVVTVNCREGITGMKETGMKVFPNPTNGIVTLKFVSGENQKCELILTDVTGREVMKEQIAIIEGENTITVNMGHFVKGVYLVKLRTSNKEIINRIVKE